MVFTLRLCAVVSPCLLGVAAPRFVTFPNPILPPTICHNFLRLCSSDESKNDVRPDDERFFRRRKGIPHEFVCNFRRPFVNQIHFSSTTFTAKELSMDLILLLPSSTTFSNTHHHMSVAPSPLIFKMTPVRIKIKIISCSVTS